MPHFVSYKELSSVILSNPEPSRLQAATFFEKHSELEKLHSKISERYGYKYLKFIKFSNSKFQSLDSWMIKNHPPKGYFEISLVPFIFLASFWKGLFSLTKNVPAEPFHTFYNLTKAHIKFLKEKDYLSEENFKLFCIEVNEDRDEKVKFSEDVKLWHGDQYFSLLKNRTLLIRFAGHITGYYWRKKTLQLIILFSILRFACFGDIKKHKILEIFRSFRATLPLEYKNYVFKKITQHQIEHLVESYNFLGDPENYDGKSHETKHKNIGTKGVRLFIGGDVSKQIWAFETLRENITMLEAQQDNQEDNKEYELEGWMQLYAEVCNVKLIGK